MMKSLFLVRRLGIRSQDLAAENVITKLDLQSCTHCTTLPELTTFPEFVEVELVDEQPVSYYDSVLRKKIPKQDWMAKSEGPGSWKRSNQALITAHKTFKNNINIAKQNFNPIGGVHIVQNIYGCKWDDEAGQVTGYKQDGWDGKDFMASIMETNTWIGPKLKDENTTNKSNNNKAPLAPWENCYSLIYPEWRRKYMNE